jgi:hypothetical protein
VKLCAVEAKQFCACGQTDIMKVEGFCKSHSKKKAVHTNVSTNTVIHFIYSIINVLKAELVHKMPKTNPVNHMPHQILTKNKLA